MFPQPDVEHQNLVHKLCYERIDELIKNNKKLYDALFWLLNLHHGCSKGGDKCEITDEEWKDALVEAQNVIDEVKL